MQSCSSTSCHQSCVAGLCARALLSVCVSVSISRVRGNWYYMGLNHHTTSVRRHPCILVHVQGTSLRVPAHAEHYVLTTFVCIWMASCLVTEVQTWQLCFCRFRQAHRRRNLKTTQPASALPVSMLYTPQPTHHFPFLCFSKNIN